MKKIVILMLIAISAFLIGCDSLNREIIETDYFSVQLIRRRRRAIVLELTELGKQQEILAIPMYVEGLPVRQIGGSRGMFGGMFHIGSENIRKLYIPHTVEEIYPRSIYISFEALIIVSKDYPKQDFISDIRLSGWHVYVVKYMCEETELNVFFNYNFEDAPNSGIFWVDFIDEEQLYLLPPTPVRRGFSFSGWYMDHLGQTPWNNLMPASAEETLRVYANWQSLK